MKKKRKQVECRVVGRNVFFYGKTARLVKRAIEVSGLTPNQFLDQAIRNSILHHELQGRLNKRTK